MLFASPVLQSVCGHMHPSQIGPYVVEKKIGAGGMGTVFLAKHQETGQRVAVKVLPASLAREEGFVARFNREIDAMKRLKNPHVVELFDSGVDNETYYYAMEFVDGETLTSHLLREKRISWREAVDITLQICVALKSAHDAGIIHRDLKPSNLLLTHDGEVKLTDFGVAQVFAGGKLTATGGIIGTAEYMSPEQAQGVRATKKSDLYSLGAVLYAMVTGRPPFTGKTTLEVIQKHRHAQFDRPSRYATDLPHWLDDIICQLLEKEPDKRFPDAYVLSRRLHEMLRKIELSSTSDTIAGPVTNSVTLVPEGGGSGPGVATLMRDLVQHEIRESQKMSPLASFFDNIWVLLLTLAMLVAGGVYWFQSRALSPEEKFEAGVAIMNEPESGEWLRARDEYFVPLIESDATAWQEKAQPYLDRIDLYDWKRRLAPARRLGAKTKARTDPERFLQLARHSFESGDRARAEQILSSLVALLAGNTDQEELHRVANSLLEEIRAQQSEMTAEDDSLAKSSLMKAEALLAEGKRNEARALCDAIVSLYADDPNERASVARAREIALRKE